MYFAAANNNGDRFGKLIGEIISELNSPITPDQIMTELRRRDPSLTDTRPNDLLQRVRDWLEKRGLSLQGGTLEDTQQSRESASMAFAHGIVLEARTGMTPERFEAVCDELAGERRPAQPAEARTVAVVDEVVRRMPESILPQHSYPRKRAER